MPFWVPIIVTLICRILVGVCAINLSKCGDDTSKLLNDAHGIELFVLHVLIIQFVNVPLIQKGLTIFMALAALWGVLQFISSLVLVKEKNPAAIHWVFARILGLIGMAVPVYWAYLVVFSRS